MKLERPNMHYQIDRQIMKAPCVLVIEKNAILRAKVVKALEEAGYTVEAASPVLDGLRKLDEVTPDLVIVGGDLPTAEGAEVCARVRQICYLPIIVLGTEDRTVETLQSGADAYMTMPLALDELVARVHAMLRRRRRGVTTRELGTD
jgi:DNA-binding response OmpR family regulator